MDQSTSKIRWAALTGTVLALLAISVPFVWQHPEVALAEGTHDEAAEYAEFLAAMANAPAGEEEQGAGACMANAKPAPLDFTLKDLDGKDHTLSYYKGKVILLNFWATWCGPCKAEIPGFVELQAQYPNDLIILGFSVDDPVDKARAYANEYKMNYPVLMGLGREDVQEAYGPIWGIPTSFVISRDGRICKKHMGIAPKAVFEKEIKALM